MECSDEHTVSWVVLLAGFVVAAVIGFAALNTLLEAVRKGSFKIYAYYCFTIGLLVIGWQLWELLLKS